MKRLLAALALLLAPTTVHATATPYAVFGGAAVAYTTTDGTGFSLVIGGYDFNTFVSTSLSQLAGNTTIDGTIEAMSGIVSLARLDFFAFNRTFFWLPFLPPVGNLDGPSLVGNTYCVLGVDQGCALAAVPEPSPLALLVFGGALLWYVLPGRSLCR